MHMDTLLQQDGAFWQVKQHRVVLPEAMWVGWKEEPLQTVLL